jgi:transglutaminase-like putative cysteine protease
MLYDISMKISYTYEVGPSRARHVIRVLPLNLPGLQRLIAGSVSISPTPEERTDFIDFFGNPASSISFRKPHPELEIRMQARVQVDALPEIADFSPLVSEISSETAACWSIDPGSPHHFLSPSPRLPYEPEIAEWARRLIKPGMSIRQAAATLCAAIYSRFTYDPNATKVDTPAGEAFKLKKGVCQDFTHVMITALRALGIPAGYVSGFLRTIPPPGKERLEGADAMHAWVRVWCGRSTGWMEWDPTNNIMAGTDHIRVGYGRDYSDVAPMIGILRIYGSHTTDQAVDVIPIKA